MVARQSTPRYGLSVASVEGGQTFLTQLICELVLDAQRLLLSVQVGLAAFDLPFARARWRRLGWMRLPDQTSRSSIS